MNLHCSCKQADKRSEYGQDGSAAKKCKQCQLGENTLQHRRRLGLPRFWRTSAWHSLGDRWRGRFSLKMNIIMWLCRLNCKMQERKKTILRDDIMRQSKGGGDPKAWSSHNPGQWIASGASNKYTTSINSSRQVLREHLLKKRMFSFGHCPNEGGGGPCPN